MLNLQVESMYHKHIILLQKGITVVTDQNESDLLKLCVRGHSYICVVNDVTQQTFEDGKIYYIPTRAAKLATIADYAKITEDAYIFTPCMEFNLQTPCVRLVKSTAEFVFTVPKRKEELCQLQLLNLCAVTPLS